MLPRRRPSIILTLLACLLLGVAAWSPLRVGAAADAPALALNTDRGLCSSVVVARGEHFPSGEAIVLLVSHTPGTAGSEGARATVAADGTFGAQVALVGCDARTPLGTPFVITARRDDGQGLSNNPALASATFTLAYDDAWAAVRAQLSAITPVYRPTWLPARFRQAPLPPAIGLGPYFGVTYASDEGDVLAFTFGPTNSAPPTTSEPVTVHGFPGRLITTGGSPRIAVTWDEAGENYAVRGELGRGSGAIARDELLRVVASLAPVGPGGKAIMPGLPNTGGGGARLRMPLPLDALIAVVSGATVIFVRRRWQSGMTCHQGRLPQVHNRENGDTPFFGRP